MSTYTLAYEVVSNTYIKVLDSELGRTELGRTPRQVAERLYDDIVTGGVIGTVMVDTRAERQGEIAVPRDELEEIVIQLEEKLPEGRCEIRRVEFAE